MPSDSHGTLIQRVYRFAEEKGMSIKAVAAEAGVSQSYLSAVLRGEKSPTIRTLDAVADALDVATWQLLSPDE